MEETKEKEFGQFETEEERDNFLRECSKLLVYSKFQNVFNNPDIDRIEAHWFYCYGNYKLTLKVCKKSGGASETLCNVPEIKYIVDKCFNDKTMKVCQIDVEKVPHLVLLNGASKLQKMLEIKDDK